MAKRYPGNLILMMVTALTLAACGDQESLGVIEVEDLERIEFAADGLKWLPPGTIVPPGQPALGFPTPYSPEQRPLRQSQARNMSDSAKYDHVPERHLPGRSVEPSPGAEFYATEMGWLLYGIDYIGVFTTVDTQTNIDLPLDSAGVWLYAQATRPPTGCLEMAVAHTRVPPYDDHTAHEFWIWNHCLERVDNPVVPHDMEDPGWEYDYVRNQGISADPEPSFNAQIYSGDCPQGQGCEPSGSPICQTAMLYNFSDGYWEELYTWCEDDPEYDYGWSFWELEETSVESHEQCDFIPSVQMINFGLMPPDGSGMTNFAEASKDYFDRGDCTLGDYYLIYEYNEGYGWRAETPHPWNYTVEDKPIRGKG